MGWGFAADITRASVRAARRVPDTPFSIGVHGWDHVRWQDQTQPHDREVLDVR